MGTDAASTSEVEKMEGTVEVHPDFKVDKTETGGSEKESKEKEGEGSYFKKIKDPNLDQFGRPLKFAAKVIKVTNKKGQSKDVVVPMEVPADHLNRAQRRKLARAHVASAKRARRKKK